MPRSTPNTNTARSLRIPRIVQYNLLLVAVLIAIHHIYYMTNVHNNFLHKRFTNNNVHRSYLPPPTNTRAQVKYLTMGDTNIDDAYSGSWWTSVSSFLRFTDIENVASSRESASFDLFMANFDKVRMTKDWLDFSVEHMSKWWEQVDVGSEGPALERVIHILKKYALSRRIVDRSYWEDVPQETLVVIAYSPYGHTDLSKWSLAATMASHISFGMGRIVVSGRLPEDEVLVVEAFDILKKQFLLNSTAELSFCLSMNEATNDAEVPFNIPRSALKKLRHVLLGRATEDINCWLGETSTKLRNGNDTKVVESRWKYIFFTEPDILLATRPSSLVALGEALEQDYVLAPHRLQPIPHGSDFEGLEVVNDTSRLIPAVEPFEHVYEVDSNNMSCCDAGQFKPKSIFEPYDNFWWQSGFDKASTEPIEAAHKHLLLYPFMRLTQGTNVVFAGTEHGKLCHLHFGASMC